MVNSLPHRFMLRSYSCLRNDYMESGVAQHHPPANYSQDQWKKNFTSAWQRLLPVLLCATRNLCIAFNTVRLRNGLLWNELCTSQVARAWFMATHIILPTRLYHIHCNPLII